MEETDIKIYLKKRNKDKEITVRLKNIFHRCKKPINGVI